MKSLQIVIFTLILLSLFITGCVQTTYKPLSEPQIQQFLTEKNVTPLAIRTIENSTVILYETQWETGIYYLSVDENGKMSIIQTTPGYDPSSPVSISCQASLVTVVINDNEILNKAYKVTAVYENKHEVTELVNNSRALLIISDESVRNTKMGCYSVIINDKDNKVLFNSTTGYSTIKYSEDRTLFTIPDEIKTTFSVGYYNYYSPPYGQRKDLIFKVGEPVILSIYTEDLRGGSFPAIANETIFVISDINNTVIWRKSFARLGEGFSGGTGGGGGESTFWNQTDKFNNTVKPGTYKAGVIFNNITYNIPNDHSGIIPFRIEP